MTERDSGGPFQSAEQCLGPEMKPTVAQTAWVLRQLCGCLERPGGASYRNLVYDLLDYDESAYIPLYDAGGMRLAQILYREATGEGWRP